MNKSVLISILIAAAVAFTVFYLNDEQAPGKFDDFARCLAQKGVTMYGADWCPHCLNEKRAFGSSFKYVPYVECPDEPKKCLAQGINGYPTWIFPDGKKLEGEQGIEKLAQESGCPIAGSN